MSTATSYFVTWEIDVFDVTTPREAAEQAFAAMQRRGTMATAFKVYQHDGNGEPVLVDLLEETVEDLTVEALQKALDDVDR